MRLQLLLVFTCFQLVAIVAPAFAQPAEGILTWAEIERRIEQADAEELKALAAELKQLPADAIEPSGDIKFAGMIGERYEVLSMPELAVHHYKQAIAIPHSREREQAYFCANMWSVAMDSLLFHYYDYDQEAKILPTLEQAKDHSAAYSFQAQYHAMQINWRAVLGDAAGSAAYAEREMAKLLREMPKSPTEGELESLIGLVDKASAVPSDAYPNGIPIRVETASYRGRPVYFQVIGEWIRAERDEGEYNETGADNFSTGIRGLLLVIATCLVIRRYRDSRMDRRGAMRFAFFIFGVGMISWVLGGSHVPTIDGEFRQIRMAFAFTIVVTIQSWLMYIATERFVRRIWPQLLTSWSRLLKGQFLDPLVGQHLLVGVVFGVSAHLLYLVQWRLFSGAWGVAYPPDVMLGGASSASAMLERVIGSIWAGLSLVLLLLALRVIFRKPWLANISLIVMFAAMSVLAAPPGADVRDHIELQRFYTC